MARRGDRFMTCPDCGKRGVSLVLQPRGEDGYSCRYCDFWVYCDRPDSIDELNMDRLKAANPETAETV